MCLKGVCTASDLVPKRSCPFGDEIIVNKQVLGETLPRTQMNCQDVFDYISTGLKKFPVTYCSNHQNFQAACCKFCESIYILKEISILLKLSQII